MSGQVIVDITMSLDGYVTGPGADADHGLGIDGEPLHEWVFSGTLEDGRILDDTTARTGAVIMGRRLFDVIDAPHGWSESIGYGADRNGPAPAFVLTHQAPETWRLGDRITSSPTVRTAPCGRPARWRGRRTSWSWAAAPSVTSSSPRAWRTC